MSNDLSAKLREAWCNHTGGEPFNKDLLLDAADRIEKIQNSMHEAMRHSTKQWVKNGQRANDQLGVVALVLANGLGLVERAMDDLVRDKE